MMAMNNNADVKSLRHSDDLLKRGFASMLKGGVIMDVVTPEQSAVAEDAEQSRLWPWKECQLTLEKQVE